MVELIPGVNNETGLVKVRIVDDYLPEDNVKLELKSCYYAAVDFNATVVVIAGGQGKPQLCTQTRLYCQISKLLTSDVIHWYNECAVCKLCVMFVIAIYNFVGKQL